MSDELSRERLRLIERVEQLHYVDDQTQQEWAGNSRDHFNRNAMLSIYETLSRYLEALERLNRTISEACHFAR